MTVLPYKLLRSRVRWLVPLLAALTLAVAGGGRPSAEAAPARWHIVVIMTDDLDVHTMETMLALGFLPNLDRWVVNRGVRFTESFVTNSLCCPSRATFLTGRYTHNHGVRSNSPGQGSVVAFDDTSTVATWLRDSGYRTGHVGKYLNEYGSRPFAPRTSPLNPHYVPPGWDHWQALVDHSTYNVYNYRINDQGTVVSYGDQPEDYQTAVLAERARRFIVESRLFFPNRPIFLSVAPIAPHVELASMWPTMLDGLQYADMWRWWIRPDPRDESRKPLRWNYIFNTLPLLPQGKPAFNESDVTDKPAPLRRPVMTDDDVAALTFQYRTRFASMPAVDDLVGAVAGALGPAIDRTIIVFTSDNGFLHGEHRMVEKVVPYEESIRVPLYIAVPGVTGPLAVDALVVNNDLTPTVAHLAGVAPRRPVDGRSLVPLLTGPAPADWRQRFLIEHWFEGSDIDVPTYAAVRTGARDAFPDRLYVEHYGDPVNPDTVTDVELYDLVEDPDQLESRHAEPGRDAERLFLVEQVTKLKTCGMSGRPSCQSLEP